MFRKRFVHEDIAHIHRVNLAFDVSAGVRNAVVAFHEHGAHAAALSNDRGFAVVDVAFGELIFHLSERLKNYPFVPVKTMPIFSRNMIMHMAQMMQSINHQLATKLV